MATRKARIVERVTAAAVDGDNGIDEYYNEEALKVMAIDACRRVVGNWENGDLAAAVRECQAVIDIADNDD